MKRFYWKKVDWETLVSWCSGAPFSFVIQMERFTMASNLRLFSKDDGDGTEWFGATVAFRLKYPGLKPFLRPVRSPFETEAEYIQRLNIEKELHRKDRLRYIQRTDPVEKEERTRDEHYIRSVCNPINFILPATAAELFPGLEPPFVTQEMRMIRKGESKADHYERMRNEFGLLYEKRRRYFDDPSFKKRMQDLIALKLAGHFRGTEEEFKNVWPNYPEALKWPKRKDGRSAAEEEEELKHIANAKWYAMDKEQPADYAEIARYQAERLESLRRSSSMKRPRPGESA